MTEEIKRPKAKRRLKDISFEHEGAHVALVSKDQGGGANGHNYALVLKANKFSEEFLEKAQRIKVELELPDFLEKFYSLWEDDAKELAKIFGWVDYEEMMDGVEDALEGERNVELLEASPEDYIRANLQDPDQMLELAGVENLAAALAALSEDQYLALLQDQEQVEKMLKKAAKKTVAKKKSKPAAVVVKAEGEGTSLAGEDSKEEQASVSKQQNINKETQSMTEEVKVIEQEVEVIAKSQFDLISKALEEQKQELSKALDVIKAFEQEKKEAIAKQRLADVKAAVENEAYAEVIFKAVKDSADEDFVAVVKALADIGLAAKQSEIFKEVGAVTEEQPATHESAVARLLKAKLQAK
jgi:hypothetical protein